MLILLHRHHHHGADLEGGGGAGGSFKSPKLKKMRHNTLTWPQNVRNPIFKDLFKNFPGEDSHGSPCRGTAFCSMYLEPPY